MIGPDVKARPFVAELTISGAVTFEARQYPLNGVVDPSARVAHEPMAIGTSATAHDQEQRLHSLMSMWRLQHPEWRLFLSDEDLAIHDREQDAA